MSTLYGMTVGHLKALLATMPESYDDRVVVLSSDPEGNSYDTLADVGVGWYRNQDEGEFHGSSLSNDDTWEDVEAQATKAYTTDEDADEDEDAEVPLDEHDHPAICLWP